MELQRQDQSNSQDPVQVETQNNHHTYETPIDSPEQSHQSDSSVDNIEPEEENADRQDLMNYQLAKNKKRRETRAPLIYGYINLVDYALYSTNEIESKEQSSYQEAISCVDS